MFNKKITSNIIVLLFFAFALTLSIKHAQAQESNLRFEHISFKQGLSQNSVVSIFQDSEGFMWFGTYDGLNKYNGYKISVYKSNPRDSNSITDDYINTIFEDHSGRIWIGTKSKGISIYNKFFDNFTSFKHNPDDEQSLSDNNVTSIYQDSKGIIWIGTNDGLNKLVDDKNLKFKVFRHNSLTPTGLFSSSINKITEDNSDNMWVATNAGLNKFDRENEIFVSYNTKSATNIDFKDITEKINTIYVDSKNILWIGSNKGLHKLISNEDKTETLVSYSHNNKNIKSLNSNKVTTIIEDDASNLWIGTLDGGLNKFDRTNEEFISYRHNPSDQFSLSADNVISIYLDRSNILWIGTNLGGINKWDKANEAIALYQTKTPISNGINSNKVRTIFEDKNKIVWIGTVDKGLNRWDPTTNKFTHFQTNHNNPNSLSYNNVRSIIQDKNNIFWIGTDGGGLNMFNETTGLFQCLNYIENDSNSISNNHVWDVFEDNEHNIWVGTFGGGLNKLEMSSLDLYTVSNYTLYEHDPNNKNSISSNMITTIFQDKENIIWIGTYGGGLNKFNKNDNTFKHYKNDFSDLNSIGNDRIYSIMEDRDGILWIGTKGSLNKFNKEDETFIKYTEKEGLPNNVVMGILEDNNGYLWLSTNNGLCRFDKNTLDVNNYDMKNGLQSNEFLVGSFCKAKDGKMLFGGINGLNAFYPDSLKQNTYPPQIVITDFKLFNKSIKTYGLKSPLNQTILKTNSITLNHRQNAFSFDFAALHYSQPLKNQYKYMMENFNEDWLETTSDRRFATYTNLDPGEYIFKIKGSNGDGLWTKNSVSINITVLPPFWATWWFRTLIATIIFGLALTWYKSRINRIQKQKQILEIQVIERTAEVEQQKEEILSQSEQLAKLSIVASETDNAVLIMDNKANIEWINEGYTQLFEYTFDQLVAEIGSNIITANTEIHIKDIVNKSITTKKTVSYQFPTKTRSGKELWIQTTMTPTFDNEGNVQKLIAIDSDITKIIEAEKEIEKQKNILKEQNDNIKGSIRYALTIQQAILPIKEEMDSEFDNFIIYKPKDIVSGDFYWFSVVNDNGHDKRKKQLEKIANSDISSIEDEYSHINYFDPNTGSKKTFLAVADCTGHGVPGAFMSMIGNRLLNEIVNEKSIYSPADILSTLDKKVKIALKQDITDNNDGMDVCFCLFEKIQKEGKTDESTKLTFCGAKRPLFLYSKKNNEIETIKADRKTIGGARVKRVIIEFTNQEIILNKGDIVYLTSDGIIDQHGPNRKRFGTNRLLSVLNENILLPMDKQKKALKEALYSYQQGQDQRDDVSVIGIKI